MKDRGHVSFTTAYDDNGNPVAEPVYRFAPKPDKAVQTRYKTSGIEMLS
jgi:hypothetical protein